MMRIAFVGKLCACAVAAASASNPATILNARPRRGPRQELRHGEHRSDAHLARIAAGDGEAAEDAKRLEVVARGFGLAHHHRRGGAVGELARVAGGDAAALDRRLDLRYALVGRVGTDALVL